MEYTQMIRDLHSFQVSRFNMLYDLSKTGFPNMSHKMINLLEVDIATQYIPDIL
jgi:hypothetical protein